MNQKEFREDRAGWPLPAEAGMKKEIERAFSFGSNESRGAEHSGEGRISGEPIFDRLSPAMKSALAEEFYFDCSSERRAELWEEYGRSHFPVSERRSSRRRGKVSIWEDFLVWLSGVERTALVEKGERRFAG